MLYKLYIIALTGNKLLCLMSYVLAPENKIIRWKAHAVLARQSRENFHGIKGISDRKDVQLSTLFSMG